MSEGGLEPPPSIRGLAPQASASTIPPPGLTKGKSTTNARVQRPGCLAIASFGDTFLFMQEDPQVALQKFVSALERHLAVAATKRDGSDEAVNRAYEQLEDAFLGYEEALQETYGEYLPFEQAAEQ